MTKKLSNVKGHNQLLEKARLNPGLTKFLDSLTKDQKENLTPLTKSSRIENLRRTVYLSSGGKYLKYAGFLLSFTYKLGYVPIHPVITLNYFISSFSHEHQKEEVMKDCFSLMLNCEELWVFDEKLPSFINKPVSSDQKPIAAFPEGIVAEIYFWLLNKPHSPIRFFRWEDVGIPKYTGAKWSLVPIRKETKSRLGAAVYPSRFGVIDLGSSTVKSTVCQVNADGDTEIINKKAITVNLAEGFFTDQKLQPPAIDRTIQAISDAQQEALSLGAIKVKLVGTGILREAKEITSFQSKIKRETGLDLEILSKDKEAKFIFQAVLESFHQDDQELVVVNAGGGSTLIVLGNKYQKLLYTLSLGISDLNEKFLSEYPVSTKRYKEMKLYIGRILTQQLSRPKNNKFLVYTGGELDYMIITGFPLEDFDLSLTHPKKISVGKFKQHSRRMRKMTLKQLHSFMPTNPNWMNGAIASNTILEAVADYFDIKTIVPSNKNLNDGLVLNMFKKK